MLLYTALIDDEGDKLRFEEIYYSYRKQMLYVAMRVLNDPMEAEDAVQTALLGIAKQIRQLPFRDEKLLRAYVLTAAKNAALNLLPKKQRMNELLDITELDTPSGEDVFHRVAVCEDYALLYRAIRSLPEVYRDVLMLRFVQELSQKEIAAVLGRKPATVHQQLTRGKKLLIQRCREEGLDYEAHTV